MNDENTSSTPGDEHGGEVSGRVADERRGRKVRRLLPLTVWLCSDTGPARDTAAGEADLASQDRRTCLRHRRAVGYELARHLIGFCTSEGEVVAEAFPSSENVLRAAVELGRRGVACVPHFPLAQHIGSRIRATVPEAGLGRVALRPCRADQMHLGLHDHLGRVSLVIAAPPPYEVGGRPAAVERGRDCPACRADLWMLGGQQLTGFLSAAWRVLRPGGRLAVITTARHEGGRLVDPAPRIIRDAAAVGFRYVQHVIAVGVPVVGDTLMVQAAPGELAELRDVRSRALPPPARVHADVCLFVKPRELAGTTGESR